MSETLSQIIAKMGTPAKPTGSTPKVPKEPKVPKVVQKARQTAVKRSPNPFVQAVEQAFKPTTPTKPQEPNLGQIIKQFKDVASSGRKQRGETLMQEYIRNTQPVSGNMGFKAGSGKGATIEAEMAAYDRKTFGAETYGKRPKGVSTAEWSKRQSHKGKFKQLAGTRNEQVAELDREIEAYKLENMTPVQRLELARETAGGLPGFYDKERASALAASLMGSQDLKDKTDASLFIRAANQVMQPVSTAYTVAMKDPRSLAEMPVGLQVGLSAGDLGAQIVGGFLTGGGSTPATASTLARIGAVATRSLALDAPGYIQMIEDAGGVDKALVAYKDMIGKALDPNSKISASERVNGIALAGMIVLSGGGKIAGKGPHADPNITTRLIETEAVPGSASDLRGEVGGVGLDAQPPLRSGVQEPVAGGVAPKGQGLKELVEGFDDEPPMPRKGTAVPPKEPAQREPRPQPQPKPEPSPETAGVSSVRKSEQLRVIQRTNPAPNDSLAWVRSESDILSFDEAATNGEYDTGFAPDFTLDDINRVRDTGTVTVYSSYPIKPGTFVTPSKMQAESYAGSGQVFSKDIHSEDVAWLDVGQGQYAPTPAVPGSASDLRGQVGGVGLDAQPPLRSGVQEPVAGVEPEKDSRLKDLVEGFDEPAKEPAKEPWQMTRKEFSGSPRLYDGKINKDDGPKLVYDSTQKAAPEPFMGKYTIRKGPSQYVVYDGDRAIATYSDGDNLVVAKAYRKQGIATELLKAYKSERDPKPTSVSRTRQAQRVYDKAHRQIVQKALAEGKPVPPEVLADYPLLKPAGRVDAEPALRPGGKEPVAGVEPEKDSRLKDLVEGFDEPEVEPLSDREKVRAAGGVVRKEDFPHLTDQQIIVANRGMPGATAKAEVKAARERIAAKGIQDLDPERIKAFNDEAEAVAAGRDEAWIDDHMIGKYETEIAELEAKGSPRSAGKLADLRSKLGEIKQRQAERVEMEAAELLRISEERKAAGTSSRVPDVKGRDSGTAKDGQTPDRKSGSSPEQELSKVEQARANLQEAVDDWKKETGGQLGSGLGAFNPRQVEKTVKVIQRLGELGVAHVEEAIRQFSEAIGRKLSKPEEAHFRKLWDENQAKPKAEGEPEVPEAATGLARQFTDPERFARDLEETRAPAKSIQNLVDETQADWDNGGSTKADQALRRANDPEYAPTREQIVKDTAMVAHLKREVKNEYDKLLRKENLSGQDFADIQAVEAKLDEIDQYAQKIRTHWHDVGMALQIAYKPDFTVADLTMRARAAHGGDISPDAQAQIKTWVDKYEAAQKELDALRKAKPPKEVANVTVSKPRAARTTALNSLAKLGIEVRGEDGAPVVVQAAGGRMKGGKQAGAVAVPNLSPSVENQLRKSIRQIAKAYIVEEHPIAGSLDGVVTLVRKHLPSLSEEDILRYLSDRYHRVLLDSDLQRRESQAFMRRIQAAADYRNKTLLEKGFAQAGALLNTTQRGLQASMDLSAPFRQGRRVMVTKEWVNAWLPSTKAMFAKDPQKAMELHSAELARSPYYLKGVESGLGISSASKPEEVWAGRLLQDWAAGKGLAAGKANPLRAYANLIQRSEAHYTIFLNDLRMRLFENLAKRNPNDKEYLESIAQMINVMTGRGHGKTATMLSHPAAGNVFYAPRYAWSEVQSTGMVPIWKTKSKMARQEAIKAYGRNFAVTVVGLSLARLFGNEVELDPRGTDFLKVRLQNGKVVDVLGASQQYLRLLVRMGYGSVSRKGFYSEPGAFGADPLMQAVNNKLSPAARSLLGLLRGWASPNADGDWQKQPPGMVLRDSVTPMGARKTGDQMWSDGDKWALLNLLGIDYEKGQPNKRQKKGSRPPKLEGLPQGMRQFAGHAPITGR